MPQHLVSPRTRDLATFGAQLSQWLGEPIPQARDIALDNLSYPSGAGMSHETILFHAHWRQDGRSVIRPLVLRVKPTANMVFPDDLFTSQYRIMKIMHERQWVPIAEPLWLEEREEVIGAPFFVMEQVRGRVAERPAVLHTARTICSIMLDCRPARLSLAQDGRPKTIFRLGLSPTTGRSACR